MRSEFNKPHPLTLDFSRPARQHRSDWRAKEGWHRAWQIYRAFRREGHDHPEAIALTYGSYEGHGWERSDPQIPRALGLAMTPEYTLVTILLRGRVWIGRQEPLWMRLMILPVPDDVRDRIEDRLRGIDEVVSATITPVSAIGLADINSEVRILI